LRLACEFRCQSAPPVPMLVSLYHPTANPRHLWDLTRLQLDRLQFPGPVEKIRLAVLLAARLASHQLELFQGEHKAGDQRQLALLIDRLSNRLGPAAVASAQLLPDAQPEYACRYEPLTGQMGATGSASVRKKASGIRARKKSAAIGSSAQSLKERPLLLEPNPIPLAVLSVVPNGPPIRFHWQGAWQRVAKTWGPERIETGWWRGRQIHRDYYRVETTAAHRFWLFRHGDGKWFSHGIFA
jgi:protein ImuB